MKELAARPERIIRALGLSPAPISTPDLVRLLAEGISPNLTALSWYGQILRRFEEKGLAVRAGKTPGGWQQPPAVTWRITDAGRQWIADRDAAPAMIAAAKSEAERAEAEARQAQTARAEALAEARATTRGRGTPRAERILVAGGLRVMGCTLEEIGDVFGVTREMIRRDLIWTPRPARAPRAPRARTARQHAERAWLQPRDPAACALSLALAREIFGLRAELGWAQTRLAAEAGIPVATLRAYERGASNYPLPVLEKVAAALGADLAQVLGKAAEASAFEGATE